MARVFDTVVNVPKCCINLPWDKKCLPCKKCVAAWSLHHMASPDETMEEFDKCFERNLEQYVQEMDR